MKHDNKWTILHSNIRGFNSKKMSFQSIVKGVNPNVVTLNEVAFRKNKKLNLPGYLSYNKNRQTESMGGVGTCIRNDEKSFALKTDEGDDKDEFIITRHNQFQKPINIVNIYGEIESRSQRKDVEDRWGRISEK
jgi:exonuclease III